MAAREDMGGVGFQGNKEVDGVNWVWFDVDGPKKNFRNTCTKDGGI